MLIQHYIALALAAFACGFLGYCWGWLNAVREARGVLDRMAPPDWIAPYLRRDA